MGLFDGCCGRQCCPSLCFRPKADTLTSLDLSHHCLQDVPNNVFSHERTLEDLVLDANQIRDLPRALFHCEGLRRLGLADNELQSIPSAVSSLTKLEELNISKNNILQIPDSIKSCKCLKVVDASINPLGPRLPDGFTQLINLQELYLNDAFLEFLPANFGRLSRLQIVELRENHIKVLPKSMSRLIDLRRLDIGQNDFLEFPEVITNLPKLSELWCDCNRIISIPNSIGNLKELTYIDASYNKIEEIASDISECYELTDLTFTSNKLTELPETIGNLTNLKILRVDENDISLLPSSIGSLSNIEELVFNDNQIESLSSNIGLLRNLHTLICDTNKLTELPVSIGSCISLRILSLANNLLKVIPDELGRLSSLKVLNLNSNCLMYLPLSLTKISNLQALWLNENQTKPLIQLQSDIDKESGQKVLTCFLLPQISNENHRNSIKDIIPSTDENSTLHDRQLIKFSNDGIDDDLDVRITTKLIRAPTPYPKELKAHARHARNLALKQKDGNNLVPIVSANGGDNHNNHVSENDEQNNRSECDLKSSHFELKDTKMSKSPLNLRHSTTSEVAKRPTTLPITSSFNNQNNKTLIKNELDSEEIEFVGTQIAKLMEHKDCGDYRTVGKTGHERKSSYKVAVNSSASCLKSPVERKIKSKSLSIIKDDSERGYKSDIEIYALDRSSTKYKTDYTSDCELNSSRLSRQKQTVPQECDSNKKKPFESNNDLDINCDSIINSQSTDMTNIPQTDYLSNDRIIDSSDVVSDSNSQQISSQSNLNLTQNINKQNYDKTDEPINAIDVNSNSSLKSYPFIGSERSLSVNSGHLPFNGSTATDNNGVSTSHYTSSRVTTTNIINKISSLPHKPLNNNSTQLDSQTTASVVSNARQRQPPTASSQFIINKFSHDSYTQSKASNGHNSNTLSSLDESHNNWNINGIDFIDDSTESSKGSNGSIGSNSCDLLNTVNNNLTHSNRYNATNNLQVFPVIIVKNPGLGFIFDCYSKQSNESTGLYVSCVEPAGSASTALKVGDKILQIDGIDVQNVTKDKANYIFESTGDTISLIVLRDKS